jgi:hypothetical protein
MIHILVALPRDVSNGCAGAAGVTGVELETAGATAADLTGVPQARQNLVSPITAAPHPVHTCSAGGCGCDAVSAAGVSDITVLAVADETADDWLLSPIFNWFEEGVLDGAAAALAAIV